MIGMAFLTWSEEFSGDLTFDSFGDLESAGDFLLLLVIFFTFISDDSFWRSGCFLGATDRFFLMSLETGKGCCSYYLIGFLVSGFLRGFAYFVIAY